MSVPSPSLTPNPWHRILDALEKKVNRHSYDTWLKPTRYSHASGGVLFIRVPTAEFQHVGDKYADLIQEAIDNLGLDYQDVKFVTPEDDPAATPVRHDGGLTVHPGGGTSPQQSRFDWDGAAQLNPRYTFDAFVIGSGNQFAQAACQAVAERPSKAYNPLFLYGGVGMGKTHLMQAIGHEIKRRQPQAAICYVSSEKFTNEMINSLRYDKMTTFRDKFRGVDVLLVDDIQFLAQKERTQEEFFHTFNSLHTERHQIVLTSDKVPKDIPGLEDRLRNRFESGLIADIAPPDLETRIAIIQKKAAADRLRLPSDVGLYIAQNVSTNVRELEGCLTRLAALASLNNSEITLEFARQALHDLIRKQEQKPDVEAIQRTVSESFHIKLVDLKSKKRTQHIAFCRQVAMYLARKLTDASFPVIGGHFGRDHSTVIHAYNLIARRISNDSAFRMSIEKIERELKATKNAA